MKFVEYVFHMFAVIFLLLAIAFAVRKGPEKSEWKLYDVSETVARVIAEKEAARIGCSVGRGAELFNAEYHFPLNRDLCNEIIVVAKEGGRVSVLNRRDRLSE